MLTWSDHRHPFLLHVMVELRLLAQQHQQLVLPRGLISLGQELMAYGALRQWASRPLALTRMVSSMAASQTLFQLRSRTFHLMLSLGCEINEIEARNVLEKTEQEAHLHPISNCSNIH